MVDLWIRVREIMAAAPPAPEDFEPRLPAADAPETIADMEGPPDYQGEPISGFSCILVYCDARGRESERRVTCQQMQRAGDVLYLVAWCHEREARRQFRVDRISELIDLRSGEIFEDAEAFLARFAVGKVQGSGLSWGLSVSKRADLVAGLNAMVFVGRCDGEWHPLEREAAEAFVAAYWLRAEVAGEPPIGDILAHADRLAPDAETFYAALTRCHGNPVLAGMIRRQLQHMMDADGRVCSEEFYWGGAVDDYLAGLANEAHPAHQV